MGNNGSSSSSVGPTERAKSRGEDRVETEEREPKKSRKEEEERGEKGPGKAKLTCLNFASNAWRHIRNEADTVNTRIEKDSFFAVMGGNMAQSSKRTVRQQQRENMKFPH